jgi:hypothetical protein
MFFFCVECPYNEFDFSLIQKKDDQYFQELFAICIPGVIRSKVSLNLPPKIVARHFFVNFSLIAQSSWFPKVSGLTFMH